MPADRVCRRRRPSRPPAPAGDRSGPLRPPTCTSTDCEWVGVKGARSSGQRIQLLQSLGLATRGSSQPQPPAIQLPFNCHSARAALPTTRPCPPSTSTHRAVGALLLRTQAANVCSAASTTAGSGAASSRDTYCRWGESGGWKCVGVCEALWQGSMYAALLDRSPVLPMVQHRTAGPVQHIPLSRSCSRHWLVWRLRESLHHSLV